MSSCLKLNSSGILFTFGGYVMKRERLEDVVAFPRQFVRTFMLLLDFHHIFDDGKS